MSMKTMSSVAKRMKMFLESLDHCDFCKYYYVYDGQCIKHNIPINNDWEGGCSGRKLIGYEFNFDNFMGDDPDDLQLTRREWEDIK